MSKKALILGDNAGIRRHLKRLIDAQPGWSVVREMASEKAMAEGPLKHSPDVVIAEMNRLDASMMPLISAIRDKFGGSKLLAVSDQQDSRLVLRIIHAGANGFMITVSFQPISVGSGGFTMPSQPTRLINCTLKR